MINFVIFFLYLVYLYYTRKKIFYTRDGKFFLYKFFDGCFCLYILYKTPLGETGCLGKPYFIYWLPKHPVF